MKIRWPFTRKDSVIPEIKNLTLPDLLKMSVGEAKWSSWTKDSWWDHETAVKLGYEASGVLFACIDKRAKAVASVPWIVETKAGEEWQPLPSHPLQNLVDRPNKDMSFSELMIYAVQFLDLSGNALFLEIRTGNEKLPSELWPVSPGGVEIITGFPDSLIGSYKIPQKNGAKKEVQAEDVIHLAYPNPLDFLYGSPLLRPGARAVDIDRESSTFQKTSLENRGVSDIAVILDPMTTQDQYDQIKKKYEERQAGARNARKPLFTNKDIKQLNQSPVELDFSNSRARVWEEICAVFGVPPPMIGLYERATLANIQEARKIFWLDTVIPLLDLISCQLNNQLTFEFGTNIRLRYDLSGVEALKENRTDKLNDAKTLWSMGMPFDNVNDYLELGAESFEGSDVGYLPAGVLPTNMDLSGGATGTNGMNDVAAKLGYGAAPGK
jgi:HK97 family phage portal protein